MQGKREQRNQQAQRKAKELEQIRTSELHQYRASAKTYIDLVDSTAGAKSNERPLLYCLETMEIQRRMEGRRGGEYMSSNPIDFNTMTEKELKPTTQAILDAIRSAEIELDAVSYTVQQDAKSGSEFICIIV